MTGMQIAFSTMTLPENYYNQKVCEYMRSYKNALKEVEKLILKYEVNRIEPSVFLLPEKYPETDDLQISRKLLNETEEIGSTILADLGGQKEILQGASGNVEGAQESTLKARDILQLMLKRSNRRAISFMILIIFFFVAICFLVYFGLIIKRKHI